MTTFSNIDLVKAYNHIKVAPQDVEKTAVSTPFGLYEWLFMPFGLRNAGSTFQRYIDNLFINENCVFIYVDDILVFSENEEQHKKDLTRVLKILEENDLRISLPKCKFFCSELDFLSFTINKDGMRPSTAKLECIKNFPEPNDSKTLRSFLGLLNYYRHLLPDFANKVFPLTELAKFNPNTKVLKLSEEERSAFNDMKENLINVSTLAHPTPGIRELQLVTDSSQYAVGAVLHQIIDKKAIPIGFYSSKLTETQRKYSTYDRELLAAYKSVLHFKHQIEGCNTTLFTDHRPLESAFKSTRPAKSDRQQRYLSLLTEYIVDVQFIKGQDNVVADCLSRPAYAVTVDIADLPSIVSEQEKDDELTQLQDRLKMYPLNNKMLWCDTSTSCPRPFIPQIIRKSVISSLHDIAHPGIKTTL